MTVRWSYFLDVDGTLIDLAETPDGARSPDGLTELLRSLHARSGGAVAVVSGRSLADLDRLLVGAPVAAAGLHGIERRDPKGRVTGVALTTAPIARVAAEMEVHAARHPGLLLERKGPALALHYRRRPALAGYAGRLANAALRQLGPSYRLQRGKRVLELRPHGADKGDVVRDFLAFTPFRGTRPVFVGDDLTDEAGFAEVERHGGMSIKVGPGRSAARWRLPDATAVRDWLLSGAPAPLPASASARRGR
jgi:trehalose 6-phosphate phosphatase